MKGRVEEKGNFKALGDKEHLKIMVQRTSLVVQGLRLHLPTEGMRIPPLVGELSSHVLHSQKTKTQHRNNIIANSIKTLKVVHIKK